MSADRARRSAVIVLVLLVVLVALTLVWAIPHMQQELYRRSVLALEQQGLDQKLSVAFSGRDATLYPKNGVTPQQFELGRTLVGGVYGVRRVSPAAKGYSEPIRAEQEAQPDTSITPLPIGQADTPTKVDDIPLAETPEEPQRAAPAEPTADRGEKESDTGRPEPAAHPSEAASPALAAPDAPSSAPVFSSPEGAAKASIEVQKGDGSAVISDTVSAQAHRTVDRPDSEAGSPQPPKTTAQSTADALHATSSGGVVNQEREAESPLFVEGSSLLSAEGYLRLAEVAAWLRARPGSRRTVSVYTRDSGNYYYNLLMSRRRGEIVLTTLMQQGVPPTQVVIRSFIGDPPGRQSSTVERPL